MMDSTKQQQQQTKPQDDHHNQPPATSQASSHFPLDPISGAVLFEQEARRRDLHTTGPGRLLTTGCRELDVEVLCGGFERGCVVGVSAEEEEVGLVLALQTLARAYCRVGAGRKEGGGGGGEESPPPRAMVITTLTMGALLPLLRDVFWGQLAAAMDGNKDQRQQQEEENKDKAGLLLKEFLETVEVARVFDIPGLWEVLGDLDGLVEEEDEGAMPRDSPRSKGEGEDVARESKLGEADSRRLASEEFMETQGAERTRELLLSSPLSDPPSSLPDGPPWEGTTDAAAEVLPRKTPPGRRDEIQDSEDEVKGSSSPSSSMGVTTVLSAGQRSEDDSEHRPADVSRQTVTPAEPPGATTTSDSTRGPAHGKNTSKRPDMIIITHISTLLSTLFQQREKSTAHQTLQLLSSHIRYLTRAPEYGGPLIMLLNSTTSSFPSLDNVNPTGAGPDRQDRPPPLAENPSLPTAPQKGANKPLDPTLRSIFNPPPLPVSGLNYAHDTPHSRRNKPSFGLIFTQMLDMHLLCTRIPKTRDDAEALYAPTETGARPVARREGVAYGWVVEALLDEMGIWEGRAAVEEGRLRKSREQRWGAVEIRRMDRKGVVIADLFGKKDMSGEVVVAAGFGGRRV